MELGCGNGLYSKRFYAFADQVYACDIEHRAIQSAKRFSTFKNVNFIEADFLLNMPCENMQLTNVVWDASINFFTEEKQLVILKKIKQRLANTGGILSGSAIIKSVETLFWEKYDHVFYSEAELRHLLESVFKNVKIIRPQYKSDVCYFMASDSQI